MKNIAALIFFLLIYYNGKSQTLREQLWGFAKNCNNAIIEGYEEAFEKTPEKLTDYCKNCIDDSRNGYLYIEGDWPTCGCSCENTIGAYRKSDGKYTVIKYEKWPCSNVFGIYSNEELTNVLPENFNLKAFGSNFRSGTSNYFHLQMEVPRVGTDTKIHLRLFPLGQIGKGNNGISWNTRKSEVKYSSLYSLQWSIAQHLKDDQQLELIISDKVGELPAAIYAKIIAQVGEGREYDNMEELIAKLSYLKNVYHAYRSLQYTSMTLSWNRQLGRFEVKDRSGQPEDMSFLAFIKEAEYFSVAC